jgi:hypothetical protein
MTNPQTPPDSNNSELKALVVDAVVAAKALLTYLDANPGKLTELKKEFKERFGQMAITKLIKLVF